MKAFSVQRTPFLCSVKARHEFCDYDYLDKLNNEEYEFLRKFNREYLNADFKHKKRLLNKKQRKKSYTDNNSRNRDIYSRTLIRGRLYSIELMTRHLLNKITINEFQRNEQIKYSREELIKLKLKKELE